VTPADGLVEAASGLMCLVYNFRGGRFYMKKHLTEHSNEDAFKTGLKTWALWMERHLDPATQVFFRSFASVHFR